MVRGNFIYSIKNPTTGDSETLKRFVGELKHKPSEERIFIESVNSYSINDDIIIMDLTYKSIGYNMRYMVRERMRECFGREKIK